MGKLRFHFFKTSRGFGISTRIENGPWLVINFRIACLVAIYGRGSDSPTGKGFFVALGYPKLFREREGYSKPFRFGPIFAEWLGGDGQR